MMKKRLARLLLVLVSVASMSVYAPRKMFDSKEEALVDALKGASKYAIDFRNFNGRIVRRDIFIDTGQEWLLDSLNNDVVATEDFQKDARKEFGKVWNNVFFVSMETADGVEEFVRQALGGFCRSSTLGTTCLSRPLVDGWVGLCRYHDCELAEEELRKIIVDAASKDPRFTIAEDVLSLGD